MVVDFAPPLDNYLRVLHLLEKESVVIGFLQELLFIDGCFEFFKHNVLSGRVGIRGCFEDHILQGVFTYIQPIGSGAKAVVYQLVNVVIGSERELQLRFLTEGIFTCFDGLQRFAMGVGLYGYCIVFVKGHQEIEATKTLV